MLSIFLALNMFLIKPNFSQPFHSVFLFKKRTNHHTQSWSFVCWLQLGCWEEHPPGYRDTHLAAAAVAQGLHDGINLLLKHLRQFSAKLIDPGSLAVVEPGVVEHQPHIIHVLPGLLVLPRVQLAFDGREIHGILHNVEIILQRHTNPCIFNRSAICWMEKAKCLREQR